MPPPPTTYYNRDVADSLLAMRGITKRFPGVLALSEVDFDVAAGEIHALMGENGAGKSTLVKVLTGVHEADAGEVTLQGQLFRPRSPSEAVSLGVSTVYQEVNLAPNLSVAENVCLGRARRICWPEMRERATAALAKLGLALDVDGPLGSFPIAVQQMVAIARALDVSAQVLVLDEPTSSLDREEVAQLFTALRALRDQGMGIVFITHFLDQVYALADRITVLRNGELVATTSTSALPRLELVSQMLGRDAASLSAASRTEGQTGQELLGVDRGASASVRGLQLAVGEGEVLGLAGLLGSGRTETLRLLFGIDPALRGTVRVGGKPQKRLSVRKAIRAGVGLCPEDRKHEALLPDLSVRENLLLVVQARRGWMRQMGKRQQRALVEEFRERLRITMTDAERPVRELSGGNQQKVILARWLAANPKVLLLDEPTRGIDVGAKFEIANLIERLRQDGLAFVFVSSELEEVVRSCSRVIVLRDRAQVGVLAGEEVDEGRIMALIAGDGS